MILISYLHVYVVCVFFTFLFDVLDVLKGGSHSHLLVGIYMYICIYVYMHMYMLVFYAGFRYQTSTSLTCQDEHALLQYSNGENGKIMFTSNPKHSLNTCPARRIPNKLSTLLKLVSLLCVCGLILALVDFPYTFLKV